MSTVAVSQKGVLLKVGPKLSQLHKPTDVVEVASYNQYRILSPPITAVDIIFLVKKHNNCDKVFTWKHIDHTRMHIEENPIICEQCGKALI